MKRRLLASIMTLVMMLSLLPTAIWAADTGDESATQKTEDTAEPVPQSGEEETPVRLRRVRSLIWLMAPLSSLRPATRSIKRAAV